MRPAAPKVKCLTAENLILVWPEVDQAQIQINPRRLVAIQADPADPILHRNDTNSK